MGGPPETLSPDAAKPRVCGMDGRRRAGDNAPHRWRSDACAESRRVSGSILVLTTSPASPAA